MKVLGRIQAHRSGVGSLSYGARYGSAVHLPSCYIQRPSSGVLPCILLHERRVGLDEIAYLWSCKLSPSRIASPRLPIQTARGEACSGSFYTCLIDDRIILEPLPCRQPAEIQKRIYLKRRDRIALRLLLTDCGESPTSVSESSHSSARPDGSRRHILANTPRISTKVN